MEQAKDNKKILLGIMLWVMMMLGCVCTARADDKTISGLGTGAIANPTPGSKDSDNPATWPNKWAGSYVYYGKYNENPVKYRVLAKDTTDFSEEVQGNKAHTMLLDCNTSLFKSKFDDSSNIWGQSYIAGSNGLNGSLFLTKTDVFTTAESNAIIPSVKNTFVADDGSGNFGKTSDNYAKLTGQKIFLLDAMEATRPSYGYNDRGVSLGNSNNKSASDGTRMKNGANNDWWLRSYSLTTPSINCSYVTLSGFLHYCAGNIQSGVSPAFNVNLSSVIFSSLISGTAGQPGAEYKLTIKDQDAYGNMLMSISSAGASREGSSQAENVYSIPYSISGTNANNATQVSVVVTTSTWTDSGWSSTAAPLQYTKLDMDNFSKSGTGSFTLDKTISGTWGTDFHVYLVAEDVNSGKATDYASMPVEIGINNNVISVHVMFKVVGGAWDDGKTTDKTVTLSRLINEDKALVLTDSDIPPVGNKPADGFTAGDWDVTPSTDIVISEDKTYTYKYTEKQKISATVNFKVVNGSWNDGSKADKTVTLMGHVGDTLRLKKEDIPPVGEKPADTYKFGSWDVIPDTTTSITKDTTYTYAYAKKDAAVVSTPPAAKNLTYKGEKQELISAGEASGGTMQYATGSDSKTVPTSWSNAIPTATEAGTYYVWYKAKGDDNHTDSTPACVKAEISPAPTVTPTITPTVTPTITPPAPHVPKGFAAMKLKQAKARKRSISFSWEKVPGATSYDVYASRCNHDGKEIQLKKIDTVKKTSYTWKGLKPGTMYKIKVKAKSGDKVVSKGVLIHVATAGGALNNPKSVVVNKKRVTIKKKDTFKINASYRADGPVAIHRKICFSSTNPDIASVNENGEIKAKRKGKCSVYAYAQNGVYKEVKVTVK